MVLYQSTCVEEAVFHSCVVECFSLYQYPSGRLREYLSVDCLLSCQFCVVCCCSFGLILACGCRCISCCCCCNYFVHPIRGFYFCVVVKGVVFVQVVDSMFHWSVFRSGCYFVVREFWFIECEFCDFFLCFGYFMCCWCENFFEWFIYLISCVNVGDWNEAECLDKFSDLVIVFDSLYLLCEWIHFGWLELGSSGGGDYWFLVQSGLLR